MKAFKIIARPVHRFFPCPIYTKDREQGRIGWHDTNHCPNCRKEFQGWQLHGENDHIQGRIADVEPATIKRAEFARSQHGPVQITVSESGYSYLG